MRIQEVKRILIALFIFSLFIGIIYVNIFAKTYVVSTGIFEDYFLGEYSATSLNTREYIWYIMKIRVFSIGLLGIIGNMKHKKPISVMWILWTGFLCGITLTAAVLKLNMKGIVLCIVGMLPHYICYITAYLILFVYIFSYPNSKWNVSKTVSIITLMLLGIITECYVNPVLMEILLSKM